MKIIVWGIGVVGAGVIRLAAALDRVEVVGGICRVYPAPKDAAKIKAGKDLGELAGLGKKLGVIASDDPDSVLAKTQADIVFVATSSSYEEADEQIVKAVESGANVISLSDPRLIYPWVHWSDLARRIDQVAKKNKVTVLETGISPGFTFDFIPSVLTGICAAVRHIKVVEVGNLEPFGDAVLDWCGLGITVEEFSRRLSSGQTRWALFPKSPEVDMIAKAIGCDLDEMKLDLQPLTSEKVKKSAFGTRIDPGIISGMRQVFNGMKDARAIVTTDRIWILEPEADGLEEGVRVFIDGDPSLNLDLKGEVLKKGDVATYAHAFNAIPQVMEAKPGLLTVIDLPPATLFR